MPATDTINFVSVADIHFNPFYTCDKKNKSCPIINKLAIASVTEWPSIFNEYETQAARYKEDTNYILLKSTLQQLKKTGMTQHPQFVLVLGDFLSHNFKENYQYFTGDSSEKGAQNFIDKTLEFLSFELAKAFPHIDIYMVVGNNDSYAKHYTSQVVFYKNIAPLWSVLIQDKKNRAEMQKALGLKQLAKNAQYLKAYKKFFSVDRSLSIFSNLTYPTLVCDLPVANDTAYKLCVNNASVL